MLVLVGWWGWHRASRTRDGYPIPGEGDRITAEVQNGSGIDGLARAMTRRLRHRGIDVVDFGTAPAAIVGSTLVILRRGEIDRAERVRAALGMGRVMVDIDTTLLLDVSVLLGTDASAAFDRRP